MSIDAVKFRVSVCKYVMFLCTGIFFIALIFPQTSDGGVVVVNVLVKCCQASFLLSIMVRLAIALSLLKSIKLNIFLVFLYLL